MRIVHVLHSNGYGGAENHALVMMKGQRARGHEVMYAGRADSWLGQACQAEGLPVLHVRLAGLYDPISHLKLWWLVRRWRPDVVHGHLIRGSFYAGVAGHVHKRPLAMCTAHATTATKHMGHCAHIIAVSQAVQANLVKHGYPLTRTSVVYNGMPDGPSAPDRQALRRELGIEDDCFAVVNAGRFIRDKGQDLLVQAAMAQANPKVRIYLIGEPATDFGRTVQALPQSTERVRYLGYRNDVQRILPAFDAYALASRREAFPLSLVEAFAAGLPVAATTVGGVPEVVLHERTGLQVQPDDAPALARAIARISEDADLAQRMASAGRQYYAQHLTDATMVDRTLAVYARCLERLPRTSARTEPSQ